MPRHDFGDDDYNAGPPLRSSGSPALVLGLVAAGLIVGLVVCGGVALFWTRTVADRRQADQGAVVTEARDARAAADDRKRAAQEAEEDRQQADYLARHVALAKAQDDSIPDRYRLLTPAQRAEVDDLRAAIGKRPAAELTERQRATLAARRDFLKHTDVLAYRLALADRDGGRGLARLLKLSHDPAVLFRLAYGEEPPDRRAKVRAAIEKAAGKGLAALSDEEWRVLNHYREHVRHLPANPPRE